MRRHIAMLSVLFLAILAQPLQAAMPVSPQAQVETQAGVDSATLDDIEEYIQGVIQEWKVPGLAIAIVKDGEVVLSKGYGYRDVDERLPVTPQTLFAIGSVSKSFTVTVLGMLVDDGALSWDEPVRSYLPDFRLMDPVASEHMTPRDLVTHRSGLPRHDGMWYGSPFTRRELYERLQYLEPNEEFRAVWQYQNLMFMTAGYLAGQLAGTTWEQLVKTRIFEPLGMARSNFSVTESQRSDDFAYPYHESDGVVRQIDFRNLDEIGPAGSINSNVEEMIRYVQFHIDKGKWNDEPLLSAVNAEAMQTPQMVLGGEQSEELGHTQYGMGLFVTTYRGQELVHHGGGIDGFISLLSFMPNRKIGMIVLTNLSGNNPTPTIVTRGVYDRLLGLEPVDWVGRTKQQQQEAETAEEKAEDETSRVDGTQPSHALAEYAGDYRHPGYGVITVGFDGESLTLTFNGVTTPLEHIHYDIFELPEDPLVFFSGAEVMFRYNKRGEINELLIPLEPSVGDIVFTRVADESMRQRAFLEPFEGEYEIAGTVLTVALRGDDTLTLTVPGQPTYELVPTRGARFELEGLSGYSLEFKRDDSGSVTEIVLYQPNGTFAATRR
jgi:CubicO group peptidase (beta-lactamase class C family)